jgi:hypothetical protein
VVGEPSFSSGHAGTFAFASHGSLNRLALPPQHKTLQVIALATSGRGDLALGYGFGDCATIMCDKAVYTSEDGGRSWQWTSDSPSDGQANSIAATTSGIFVTGSRSPVYVTRDGRQAMTASLGPERTDAGYDYVAFTTPAHGVLLSGSPNEHQIWLTEDGGRQWRSSVFRSAQPARPTVGPTPAPVDVSPVVAGSTGPQWQ